MGAARSFSIYFCRIFDSVDRSLPFLKHGPERCAKVGFPPSGSYQASLGSARSFSSCFWRFFDSVDGSMVFKHSPESCARVGFPPSVSYQASLGSVHVFCSCFWVFFDSVNRSMDFVIICQKDAQGSVFPLRVRVKRVWALRTRFAAVFRCSLIRWTEVCILKAYARKMRKGRFPPFGFVSSEFGLCALV